MQHASACLGELRQDLIHPVVPVGNAFPIETVAGLPFMDLDHGQ